MKKYFVPIALILLLAGSASYAWMGAGQMAGSVPVSGVTPTASYALDAAGGSGSQIYNSIAAAWEGGGADTVSFASGYLESDSTTDRCYVNDVRFEGFTSAMTITFEYQVSNAADGNLMPLNTTGSGYTLYMRHYQVAGYSGLGWRNNFGTSYSVRWSNSGLSANTWYSIVIQINFDADTVAVLLDGSAQTLSSETGNAGLNPMTDIPANTLFAGFVSSGTNVIRVRNLNVYSGIVTP